MAHIDEESKFLIVAGDPILDIYLKETIENNRISTNQVLQKEGGALNVWNNAAKILDFRLNTYFCFDDKPYQLVKFKNFYTIIRSNLFERNVCLVPKSKKTEYYSSVGEITKAINQTINKKKTLHSYPKGVVGGLVLSDYNKGILNREIYEESIDFPFEFCIVDSKYRSINKELFRSSKVSIWHATGEEYSHEYAKNFDWVLHTNGKDPVRIMRGNALLANDREYIELVSVPNTLVVNSCGAGDTFTAAVGAYLIKNVDKVITKELLKSATMFAVDCCQEVIINPYTATTTKKLR